MRKLTPLAIVLAILISLMAPLAQAQFDSGTVLGTIKDSSGKGISTATVVLHSHAKGLNFTRQTDKSGDYEFTSVQPGDYSMTVAAAGFETADTGSFTVTVNSRQRVELSLKVGAASEAVSVSGAASILQTDASDRGETIETEQAVNLPLNGRAYADLSILVPGVRESLLETLSSPSRDASYNVNGMTSMVNNFQLDGIDNNAYQTANQGYSNQAIIPSPDAVQEFKVQTDNYSAEYGRAAGAVINATTRSGTNQFHGVAYDYLRNTVLNAYGPFIGTGVKPTLVQNQFGGAVGGPVKRDRLFFFADYEGLRHVDHSIVTAVVPTLTQSSGTFTDQNGKPIPLINSLTGASYADGVIPQSAISPFAAKVLSLLPVPNTVVSAGGNNYVSSPANTINNNKGDGRLDAFLSPRSTAFVRYSQNSEVFFIAPNIPGLAGGNTNGTIYAYTRQIASGYNFSPSASSMLQLRLGLTWTNSGKQPMFLGQDDLLQDFNIPNTPNDPSINGGLNTQSVTGFSQFGRQSSNPQFTNPYLANPKINYNYHRGRNSMNVGYEYGYLSIAISDFHPQYGEDDYGGQFSRVAAATASDIVHRQAYNLADFLMGARSSYQLNNLATINYERRYHMGYIQDDYKVTDKLTFNLGLRYELVTPNWEQHNLLANFDPTTNQLRQASSGSLYNRTLINLATKDFAPRIGFAWQVAPQTVVRAGYGIGYIHNFRFGGESTLGYNGPNIVDAAISQEPPFQISGPTQPLCTSLTENPFTCFRTTQSGYETNFATPQNFSTLTSTARYIPRNSPEGYVQTYHFTIEQQLPRSTTLELSYVGNHGTHLGVLGDYNQAASEPSSCNTGIGCVTMQARRPISTFSTIETLFPEGFLVYNALQTKLEHRSTHGLYLINSFTWSKGINNASTDLEKNGGDSASINIADPAGDRGVSGYDQPLNDTLSFVADLPFGRGRAFGTSAPGWQQALIGGWTVSAINLAASGLPINLTYSPNYGDIGVSYSTRPNLVGAPSAVYAPRSKWVKTATGLGGTLNFASVSVPLPSQPFGNAGRNDLRGPSFEQLDLAVHKAIPLHSETRNLEFRMEAFNVFNFTNFQTPDSSVTDGAASFGTYTAATAYPAREVQVAFRLTF